MKIGKPATLLGNADWHHVKTSLINCVEYRCRRKQRDLVFTAATAKKNADAKFLQSCSPFSVLRSPVERIKQQSADGPSVISKKRRRNPALHYQRSNFPIV